MKVMDKIIAQAGGAKIVFTVPLPRYALVPCWSDTNHVSKRQDLEFLTEIYPENASLRPMQQANGPLKPEY
jgi:hypothetical protein